MTRDTFPSWPEAASRLIAVAAGREPADMVIRGGIWVNVHSRECLPGHDIAIASGRIACVVPDAGYCTGPQTAVIEAGGQYMIPGLCDAHMHIESGMLTPAEFAETHAVLDAFESSAEANAGAGCSTRSSRLNPSTTRSQPARTASTAASSGEW